MPEHDSDIAARLRVALAAQSEFSRMSQATVATTLRVDSAQVSRWFKGVDAVPARHAEPLARLLAISNPADICPAWQPAALPLGHPELGEAGGTSKEAVHKRLAALRLGRLPHPFGAHVQLPRSTVSRLVQGRLPAPQTFAPMCRIEGVSLTWVLTGQGSPYCLTTAVDDQHAWTLMRQRLAEAPSEWSALIVRAGDRFAQGASDWTVILHRMRDSERAASTPYAWRETLTLAGAVCGPHVAAGLSTWARSIAIEAMDISAAAFQRLVTGYLGPSEIWGAKDVPAVGQAVPVEPAGLSDWLPTAEPRRAQHRVLDNDADAGTIAGFLGLDATLKQHVSGIIGALAKRP